MPTMPPPSASSTLSISNWRTMAARLPPSAMRVAISRLRAPDRASSSPAMFTQPISSTISTAAQVSSSSERTSCVAPVCSGMMRSSKFFTSRGKAGSAFSAWLSDRSCSLACAQLTPGFRRAIDFVVGSAALTLPAGTQGRPDVHRRGGAEIARHDADHRVLFAAQADGAAEHRRVAMEDPLPEGVTQNRHRRAVGNVFLAAEFPADPRRDAQHPEIARRDALLLDVLRAVVGGEVDAAGPGVRRHVQCRRRGREPLRTGRRSAKC